MDSQGLRVLSDKHLSEKLEGLVRAERKLGVLLLRHLAEFSVRKLYAPYGYPSMYNYCVQHLRYSEGSAFRRATAARALNLYPYAAALLEKGDLHVTAFSMIAPELSEENHRDLLLAACGKSKRELEAVIVALRGFDPAKFARDWVRPLGFAVMPRAALESGGAEESLSSHADSQSDADRPEPSQAAPTEHFPAPEPIEDEKEKFSAVRAMARLAGWYRFGFTGDQKLFEKLERVKELLRHRCPGGRMDSLLSAVLEDWLEKHDPDRRVARKSSSKKAVVDDERVAEQDGPISSDAPDQPRDEDGGAGNPPGNAPAKRYIPRQVRDEVWKRDGGRCSFVGAAGRRCEQRGALEFDHLIPWALGGPSNRASNIRLLCRAHNQWELKRKMPQAYARYLGGREKPPDGATA